MSKPMQFALLMLATLTAFSVTVAPPAGNRAAGVVAIVALLLVGLYGLSK